MLIRPWWERFPGRLEWEIERLRIAGYEPELDDGQRREHRLIEIRLRDRRDGRDLALRARLPDMYPYVRPEVSTNDLSLGRHQSPIGGNLCLIGRSTENWVPTDSLEWLVTEQLPAVIAAVEARRRGEPSPVPEEAQGEPASDYHLTVPGSALLFDSAWAIPSHVRHGQLELIVDRAHLSGGLVRGVIDKVMSDAGRVIVRAPRGLVSTVPEPRRGVLTGKWVRLDATPRQGPDGSVEPLLAQIAESHRAKRHAAGPGLDGVDALGIVFREELGPDLVGDGWTFVARSLDSARPPYLARAMRAGPSDLASRVPSLGELHSKTVLVVGLGGIGAPATIEFAKAGIGELRLVDHDVVEPGPAVRYPFGLYTAGFPKGQVLVEHIALQWPYTAVSWVSERIGDVRGDGRPEFELLTDLLDGVDLIFDATAERGIHHVLADLAAEAGIDYVEAATRNGAWGGHVARVRPGADGCWLCLSHWLDDRLNGDEPELAIEPGGLRQPIGCADPTFTGTGFDVAEFALAAVRLAIGTLLADAPGGYPDVAWDVALINLRRHDGSLDVPSWTTFVLERHPACGRCRQR